MATNHLEIFYMNTYTDTDLSTNKTIRSFLDDRHSINLQSHLTKKTDFFIHDGTLSTRRRASILSDFTEDRKFIRMGLPQEHIAMGDGSTIYKCYFRLDHFRVQVDREQYWFLQFAEELGGMMNFVFFMGLTIVLMTGRQ